MSKSSKNSSDSKTDEMKTASKLFKLGYKLMQEDELDVAIDSFKKALEIYRRHIGENYESVGYLHSNLATCYTQKWEMEKAESHLKLALDNYGCSKR